MLQSVEPDVGEDRGLLGPSNVSDAKAEAEAAEVLLRNYNVMVLCFSLNMGAVTSAIAFASTDFKALGNESTGTVYGSYCIVALFLSNPILHTWSTKTCLVCGTLMYCCYLVCYVIAALVGSRAAALVIVGSAVGGIASGFLWVAKGEFFSECARQYTRLTLPPGAKQDGEARRQHQLKVTGMLATRFGTVYLFAEVGFKLAAAVIRQASEASGGGTGAVVMYAVLAAISLGAALGMGTITPLLSSPHSPAEGRDDAGASSDSGGKGGEGGGVSDTWTEQSTTPPQPPPTALSKAAAALALLVSDPIMALLLPFEASFGLLSAFLNAHVAAKVLPLSFPSYAVGYFAALVALVACGVSAGGGAFIKATGSKRPVMVAGATCFALVGAMFVSSSDQALAAPWALVGLYVLQGMGRGVFESCNQSVVSDFFPDDAPAAFANVACASGGASALGYLVVADLGSRTQGAVALAVSVAGLVCYCAADCLFQRRTGAM
jgi:MFS family permease